MKKHSVVLLILFLASCRSLTFQDMRLNDASSQPLPPLEPIVDVASLENAYSTGKVTVDTYYSPYSRYGTYGSSTGRIVKDPRVQDAVNLFQRDVKENLTRTAGQTSGFIRMKILNSSESRCFMCMFGSMLTAFTVNLFSVPLDYHSQTTEYEFEIFDVNKNPVARYVELTQSKTPIALWRGYVPATAERRDALMTLKYALFNLHRKVQRDFAQINNNLAKGNAQ